MLLVWAAPLLVVLWPFVYIALGVVGVQWCLFWHVLQGYKWLRLDHLYRGESDLNESNGSALGNVLRLFALCGIFSVLSALSVLLHLAAEAAVGVYSGGNYVDELKYSFDMDTRQGVVETIRDDCSWVLAII